MNYTNDQMLEDALRAGREKSEHIVTLERELAQVKEDLRRALLRLGQAEAVDGRFWRDAWDSAVGEIARLRTRVSLYERMRPDIAADALLLTNNEELAALKQENEILKGRLATAERRLAQCLAEQSKEG